MVKSSHGLALLAGVGLGVIGCWSYFSKPTPVAAASGDRFQDYVMATGAVNLSAKSQSDGVWLLDYKSGKLLGTVIDKTQGKIVGWAEVDLVSEFEVAPRQEVHFMMVTGYITQGQSALYVAETSTGKFGVYTMGPGANGTGVAVRRHDLTSFRKAPDAAQPAPPAPGPMPGLPPLKPGGE
jgi:hypothetical protein